MGSNPSATFYWNDYENDRALMVCSFAAQGLWMRMLCIMARSNPIGHLVHAGLPMTIDTLTRLTAAVSEPVSELLSELEANEVFSRLPDNTIYCRRMVKKAAISEKNKINGIMGVKARGLKIKEKQYVAKRTANQLANLTGEQKLSEPSSEPLSPSYLQDSKTPVIINPPSGDLGGVVEKTKKPRRIGTLIPDDWKPTEGDIQWAIGRGWNMYDIKSATEQFVLYWGSRSTDAAKADWSKTFRNRLIDLEKKPGWKKVVFQHTGPATLPEDFSGWPLARWKGLAMKMQVYGTGWPYTDIPGPGKKGCPMPENIQKQFGLVNSELEVCA